MPAPARVRMLDLAAQHAALGDELRAALEGVLASGQLVLGPEVEALERELADFCETAHAVACGSGTDALRLALTALDVGAGDEVLCPGFSFFASAGAIALQGARPVFADVDPASCGVTPASLRQAARGCSRLRAVLVVHLYGRPLELAPLLDVARELGVPLIEDAAQAIGARDASGRRVGGHGAVGCFSFYPTKNLAGAGEGGLCTTDDPALAARIARLRNHGQGPDQRHVEVGFNARMDALQAAVLRVKLPHLEPWTEARRAHAAGYDAAFAAAGARDARAPLDAGGLPLRTPAPLVAPAGHVYHQYVVRVPAARRAALIAHLAERGVESAVYYPLGLHQQPCFADAAPAAGLPATEAAAREVLALPVHEQLAPDQLGRVVDAVLEFLSA
ncbi:MAG: DegT/DnrJ/EryC1/StrS family aminotransferase [Myxococcota bacterium]|nr:DegT/DnrJ/EryC1/StrS family aminotransferase [Myxococcota bacterium]